MLRQRFCTPEVHYYETEGTCLNMHNIIGSAHARIIQCLQVLKTLSRRLRAFEGLADAPASGGNAQVE
eukprot:1748254-Pyramimonas_sp.AAC.1